MMLHAPRSLWIRLVAGLATISLLAVAVSVAMFRYGFETRTVQFRERALENQAHIIAKVLRRAGSGEAIQLSDFSESLKDGDGLYAIISSQGELVSASPGLTSPLTSISSNADRDFFVLHGNRKKPPYYGISTRAVYGGRDVWIQIAFASGGIALASAFKDFVKDVVWMWLGLVAVLLIFNLLVARIGLQPLRRAATSAAAVGPGDSARRIDEGGLPDEVLSLVSAVNRALDRLEQAFLAQKRFVADAAHELRTPVAVLKVHADLMPASDENRRLQHEIRGLERLVGQLLDHARLDGLHLSHSDRADWHAIAVEVATQLSPVAIAAGKSIEVIGDQQVSIHGSHEYLARALRNLVENAIAHTPSGTAVSVSVRCPGTISVRDHGSGVPPHLREVIFHRFWQGARDRGGAGLGMDIIARTVRQHGGTIEVTDAPGGGGLFTIQLPPAAS